MKKLVLLVVLATIFSATYAQSPVNLGLKVGYNSSKITTSLDQFNEGSVNNFLAGAFVRVNFGKIYLQPEAYFNSKGGELKEVVGTSPSQTVNSFDLKSVDVPVLLGYKIVEKGPVNLRVNTGPLFSFLTSKEANSTTFDPDKLKDNYFGWQYGAGVDIYFLSLDVRMENSFGDIYAGKGDEKSKTFLVTLGIKLL